MAVLSNASGGYVRRVMQVHGLEKYFKISLGADDVQRAKPAPDGLLHIMKNYIEPESSQSGRNVYIGDSISDGKAAKAAGMIGLGVGWGENKKEILVESRAFDEVFEQVDMLSDILLNSSKN